MNKQRELPLDGGFCCGPLFAPVSFRPPVVVKRMSGGKVVWRKYKRAKPPWTTWKECAAFWEESKRLTRETGIQHSVDHIVPLLHPYVCGLHCPANLRVIPMAENAAKSNVWWPDMSVEQVPLFDEAAIKVGFSPSHPSPMGSVTNDYGFLLVHQRVEHQGLPSDATPQGLPSVSC